MTDPVAVRFENVSKYFTLDRSRPRSIQELLLRKVRRQTTLEKFWVLRDVSFHLERGTTTGFVGVNGAGKSTALKLISGIIKPTAGRVQTAGRIGALLELGAGFHPDLTGRENIYLNAAILGLDREYVKRRFDEIVAFSELDEFIDVPVKHYSSGMYIRLGFSIAVHTEPEILLIDEVLAVGDTSFQHKCLRRISDLRRQGVTIILVTHDLNAVQTLCQQAIWFEDGVIEAMGDTREVTMRYLASVAEKEEQQWRSDTTRSCANISEVPVRKIGDSRRWGSQRISITDVQLLDANGTMCSTFRTGKPLTVRMHYSAPELVSEPTFGLAVFHENGMHISGPNTLFGNLHVDAVLGDGYVEYVIPNLTLLEGAYDISVAVHDKSDADMYDYHDRLYRIRVYPGTVDDERYGLVTLQGEWRITKLS